MDIKSSSAKDINQRKLFVWLWQGYLRRHVWVLSFIVVLIMIEGSMVGGLAWMMQPLFDGVFVGGSYAQLWVIGVIVFGLFSCPWCFVSSAPGFDDKNRQAIGG